MQNSDRIQLKGIAELSTAERIDAICDAYERDLTQGRNPQLTSYLGIVESNERSQLFTELLLVDIELHTHDSNEPDWGKYETNFPEFAQEIEATRFKLTAQSFRQAPTDSHPDADRTIGRFKLLEKIGSGATGDVWRALDPRLDRTVAIKILRAPQPSDGDLSRFFREARASAQLAHPNIVQVYEISHDADKAYIVSAIVSGISLRSFLNRSRPAPRESAELCRQLAEALHHAHEQGVIHRDMKPSNVVVDEVGRPHITDFGLAKWADDGQELTLDGQQLGTPAYMSPEQARGDAARADRRTDVYSLGIILYEMLTGRCPFEGNQSALTYQIIHQDPSRPRGLDRSIPRDLETICLKAMEKDPARRYLSAQEMAVDLRRFVNGDPILTRRVSHVERAWRAIRRHPAKAASVILFLMVVASLMLANQLAKEKHQLLGLRRVSLTTKPPNARIVFVPLDPVTGDPDESKAIRPQERSPVSTELAPGDYLVVAALDDGRFHEVCRHVPKYDTEPSRGFRHGRWNMTPKGTIELTMVKIPASSVTQNMAYLPGAAQSNAEMAYVAPTVKDGFFMDCTEITVELFQQQSVDASGKVPSNTGLDWPMPLNYETALEVAEVLGKRLPSEAECDYALSLIPATMDSTQSETEWSQAGIGPVGQYRKDATSTVPPVVGLRSNVAEWTTSRPAAVLASSNHRIVLGAEIARRHFTSDSNSADIDVWDEAQIDQNANNPWIGFRCIRSKKPRFLD